MEKKKNKKGVVPPGRPSEYDAVKTPELAQYYLKNFEEFDDVIPSIAGLAVALGISRETVYAWAKEEDRKEFSDILGNILSKQEQTLVTKGLNGKFNPQITKLVLGKHGYKESKESDINIKSVSLTDLFIKAQENGK